jgi:hypothetical protein
MEQNQQPTVSLALPIPAIQLVMTALGKLPLETSLPLYQHIASETERQMQEAAVKFAISKEVANAQP